LIAMKTGLDTRSMSSQSMQPLQGNSKYLQTKKFN
jgi:hypothetical protein